jgi:hypothetical protein
MKKIAKNGLRIRPIEINVDFDATCVTHSFPDLGKEIGAAPVLKTLTENGHRLILFTMRSDNNSIPTVHSDSADIVPEKGDFLKQAVDWFASHNIPLYGIQENPTQKSWTTSPKSYAQLMIDDSALGCPLMTNPISDRPFVDWYVVMELLYDKNLITYEQFMELSDNYTIG